MLRMYHDRRHLADGIRVRKKGSAGIERFSVRGGGGEVDDDHAFLAIGGIEGEAAAEGLNDGLSHDAV